MERICAAGRCSAYQRSSVAIIDSSTPEPCDSPVPEAADVPTHDLPPCGIPGTNCLVALPLAAYPRGALQRLILSLVDHHLPPPHELLIIGIERGQRVLWCGNLHFPAIALRSLDQKVNEAMHTREKPRVVQRSIAKPLSVSSFLLAALPGFLQSFRSFLLSHRYLPFPR